jgi:tRNA wybutosine-synthesizing protein 2
MVESQINQIKKNLSRNLTIDLIKKLPEKWEKIGDVLIFRLPSELLNYKTEIGKTYSDILNSKTVLNEIGTVSGIFRKPKVEIIYGSSDTITVHKENGIRFKLDPIKIMFSSGNMDERIRMANISNENETVVDLFAGIGYFTIPIGVHSKPEKIFAVEINPVSFDFLKQNIVLNDVTNNIVPLYGDNREIAPENTADRVIVGYLEKTHDYLPIAIKCLKNKSGFIHFHTLCSKEINPEKNLKMIKTIGDKQNVKTKLLKQVHVKSYAPGVDHFVFDLKIDEK